MFEEIRIKSSPDEEKKKRENNEIFLDGYCCQWWIKILRMMEGKVSSSSMMAICDAMNVDDFQFDKLIELNRTNVKSEQR